MVAERWFAEDFEDGNDADAVDWEAIQAEIHKEMDAIRAMDAERDAQPVMDVPWDTDEAPF